MDYLITEYVIMEVLIVVGALVHQHWWDKTLYIRAVENKRCLLEWCYFTSLGTKQPVACEEVIGAYNLALDSIWTKYDIITIPHLLWVRLYVL